MVVFEIDRHIHFLEGKPSTFYRFVALHGDDQEPEVHPCVASEDADDMPSSSVAGVGPGRGDAAQQDPCKGSSQPLEGTREGWSRSVPFGEAFGCFCV